MIFRRRPKSDPSRKRMSVSRRFMDDGRGTTAIEFGILATPFLVLLFAIFESALSYSAQQLLMNVTDRIARDIRTGELRAAALNEVTLKRLICEDLDLVVADNCPELEVDLAQYPSFAAVPTAVAFQANGDINTSGFRVAPGGPSSINQLRVFYRWPVTTDLLRQQMSNLPDGKTLLFATAAWRNEPFDP